VPGTAVDGQNLTKAIALVFQ